MTSIRVRGCAIEVDRSGAGPDLIWAHGLGQSRELEDRRAMFDWTGVGASVVRYDARGHGGSESTVDLDSYGWDQLALDQLALADELGIDRYVAAGASMGCATALHAAVTAPERIRGLVLVIPPTGWETRAAQTDMYEAGAQVVETHGVEPVIRASALTPPPDPFADDPLFSELRADAMRSWDPERLTRVMRGAARAQLPERDAISRIECPSLVLAWTGDAVHPTSTADELARLMPGSETHLASTAEDVQSWSSLVAGFVQRVERSDPWRVDDDTHA
jgi:pimeloyl-ACP methyl ester carboxylesterase